MDTETIDVRTGDQPAVVDISEFVVRFCRGRANGLLNVFVPHATAGLALVETGSGTEADLLTTVESILPRSRSWTHRHGSAGHGGDHVLPALISPSLIIPVFDGVPALGRWQSVVLVDPNRDNATRQVRLSFVPA